MLTKRQADKPNNSLQTVSKIQTKNKRNANKRRSIKLQQIRKRGKQVKENATGWHFRHFSPRRKEESGNPIFRR